MITQPTSLKRSIGLGLLTLYGIGTMTGAGIYVLVGKVAGYAGMSAPLAFILASVVAAFTAFSYAQLSSILPKSAGEVVYIQEGLGIRFISQLVGWLVVISGTVSSASLITGFAGYLDVLIVLPNTAVEVFMVLLLGGIVIWGVTTSVGVAALISLIEIGGLIVIIFIGAPYLIELPGHLSVIMDFSNFDLVKGMMLGSFLAFFAFIGFEDLANMAEETRNPTVNVPKSIVYSLVFVTVLYILVSTISVLALPLDKLGNSDAPLADFMLQENPRLTNLIVVISLVAVINGVLIQMIMCSRVLYGMARDGLAPEPLGRVSQFTRTPVIASIIVITMILLLTLWLPIVTLANTTSYVILIVFILVNASLIAMNKRGSAQKAPIRIPEWIPWAGLILSFCFLLGKTILELI
ncbi:MAG: amino acid permease [Saprospiraceae bacterium]|nr:amino acid permease [Saprospiraceae bacterium]